MLTVRDLRVTYGGAIIGLRRVSLDVPQGSIVAVLGSNGAGKSTLLRAMSGVLGEYGGAVAEGYLEFDGQRLAGKSAAAIVRSGIVQSPEGRKIFSQLSVAENLRIGGFTVSNSKLLNQTRDLVYEIFPILHQYRDKRAILLSGGQQQMLAIGRAMMAQPKVLLLDEPSLGLAPQVVGQIGRVVTDINRRGTTVVLVEQNAAMALGVATHAYVLSTGEVALAGPAKELAANDDVRALYLGHATEHAVSEELTSAVSRPQISRWQG
jgi:branched-chain amino acid transport system ATP-binding protein